MLALFNLLEDGADDEPMLLTSYFREEDDEIFSERSREGSFNVSYLETIKSITKHGLENIFSKYYLF